jgi:hypothetical protein
MNEALVKQPSNSEPIAITQQPDNDKQRVDDKWIAHDDDTKCNHHF